MKDSFFANTELIGLIGHPIKHSYSPFIQNYTLELMDLDYIYLAFDVPSENLKNAVNSVLALGLKGLNVTLPHKEKIIKHLDELSEEAFDDQCTGANPRYPLICEIKELYMKVYNG